MEEEKRQNGDEAWHMKSGKDAHSMGMGAGMKTTEASKTAKGSMRLGGGGGCHHLLRRESST